MSSVTNVTLTKDFTGDPPGNPVLSDLQAQLVLLQNAHNNVVAALDAFVRDDDSLVDDHVRLRMLHDEVIAAINAGDGDGNDTLEAMASVTAAANKILYFTSATVAALLDFLDEDTLASDSDTAVASQQSIKAYVDARLSDDATLVDEATDVAPTERAVKRYVDTVQINAQTGTTYTLALSDRGKLVTLDNVGAITVTVPANATIALPIGTMIELTQLGAGQVTVAAAAGVTIRSEGGLLALAAQYATVSLTKIATDTWLLAGSLA